jgi:hypothetical protein
MNKKHFLILFIVVLCNWQCNNSKSIANSCDIYRYNYFDRSKFKLNDVDTNKFDRELLESAIEVVSYNGDSKFLMTEIISENIPARDCTLFDIATNKCYKLLIQNNKFHFKEIGDSVNINRLNRINANLNILQQRAETPMQKNIHRHDWTYYIVNVIEAKEKSIFMKSYYLTELF